MGIAEWGSVVAAVSGLAFFIAAIVALVVRRRSMAGYLAVTGYVLLWPIHLWFSQFTLTGRAPTGFGYIWNGVGQVLVATFFLVRTCFRQFKPIATAIILLYVFSLLLQIFSYVYWSYGIAKNFSISLSHLDSFYFALGTLSTAGTGAISAVSDTARAIQTLQMGLDFIFIGFVVALVVTRYSNLLTRPQKEILHNTTGEGSPTRTVNGQKTPKRITLSRISAGLLAATVIVSWSVLRVICRWLSPHNSNP